MAWWIISILIFIFIGFLFWFIPVYDVWAARKRGQSQLAEAEFAEQVAIMEATARLKSAKMNQEAEEIEATAVANSMKIIGDSLKANDGYLRWQWIKALEKTNSDIIYVPTEANLPILEATRTKDLEKASA
ncbi:MAG: membrane protease subunit [Candidatus Thorarchaeota archaeon]